MEKLPVFCINLCESLTFTAPPISVPILRSASDETSFFIILPSDQQIENVAHLKSYIEELFRISSPTSLHSSNGNVLKNEKGVKSFNSIAHRRILVRAPTDANNVPEMSTSSKTTTASDVRRCLSNEELRKQHGITSNIKIMLNRDEIKAQSGMTGGCSPCSSTSVSSKRVWPRKNEPSEYPARNTRSNKVVAGGIRREKSRKNAVAAPRS